MKIKWLGHAAFEITADDGTSILTDPYRPGAFDGAIGYDPITERFDIVTVSHKHADHDGVDGLPGSPTILDQAGKTSANGIAIEGINSFHDKTGGSQRGGNIIFCFKVDGIKVCHLGDLGHFPDEAIMAKLSDVDILLIPVGGTFTIDAAEASAIVAHIGPKLAIPMHFKTPKVGFDLAGVDAFTAGKSNVEIAVSAEVEFDLGSLPAKTKIVVLKHAK